MAASSDRDSDFSAFFLDETEVALPGTLDSYDGVQELLEEVGRLMQQAKASATRKAYRSDWQQFERWCGERHFSALPAKPETVALYLADLKRTHKPATLTRKLCSLGRAHEAAGYPSPATMREAVVSETMKGIRREKGTAQNGKEALLAEDLRRILTQLPDTLQGQRDKTLLLFGFAGGFRRSELALLQIEDIDLVPEGMIVQLPRSKTDPEGEGALVGLPYGSRATTCPVRNYEIWLQRTGLTEGPVFREINRHEQLGERPLHPSSVARVVKRAVKSAGLDPAAFSGHSLRAGFVTQAYLNDASEVDIMRQTRHKSLSTMRRYIRAHTLFQRNPAAKLGL
jgi:integrase